MPKIYLDQSLDPERKKTLKILSPLFPLTPTPFLPLFHPRDLASNKAYSLGRRAAYRDYVDLYFLLRNYSLEEIIKDSQKRFGGAFSAKLFLEQLVYFDDLDSFKVDFLGQEKPSFEKVKKFLEQKVEKYLSFINSNN